MDEGVRTRGPAPPPWWCASRATSARCGGSSAGPAARTAGRAEPRGASAEGHGGAEAKHTEDESVEEDLEERYHHHHRELRRLREYHRPVPHCRHARPSHIGREDVRLPAGGKARVELLVVREERQLRRPRREGVRARVVVVGEEPPAASALSARRQGASRGASMAGGRGERGRSEGTRTRERAGKATAKRQGRSPEGPVHGMESRARARGAT
jgi:hypothetical protein